MKVIKLVDGTYYMVVNELYNAAAMWMPTRAANWKSANGYTWTRISRVSGIKFDSRVASEEDEFTKKYMLIPL